MFVGHFGLAAAVKGKEPRAPLWTLMLSTQLLDVFFVVLFLLGLEGFVAIDPGDPNAYGGAIIHAPYTHSLVGAALISLGAGWLVTRAWGRRIGTIIGSVVFSHWLLDLLVHRPDLPILPGNLGNLPLLGFGLWDYPAISIALELALVVAGALMYLKAAMQAPAAAQGSTDQARRRRLISVLATSGLMLVALVGSMMGM